MNAVGYTRLSTRDQSKSLEYQENIIRRYCTSNGLEVLEVFSDNGHSSYNFDRPDYLALEKFIRKHKGKCSYLVVLDHDRFSRNLAEALIKIDELEKKYNVSVVSTNESLEQDSSDPNVFMKRAFEYLIANTELLNIRSRVKRGILNAKEHGRYLGKAPFGYRNARNADDQGYIVIDQHEAKIVRKIFRDYLLCVDPTTIHKNIKEIGFNNYGRNAIYYLLRNCTYAGLVKVPSIKGTMTKHVHAVHKPIISEEDFWAVQQKICWRPLRKSRHREDFPLRGVIRCNCGRKLTAGWSRGRADRYYMYYKCSGPCRSNISGVKLHEKFERILRAITFLPHQFDLIKEMAKPLLKTAYMAEHRISREKKRRRNTITSKILQLQEKFIANHIDREVYNSWNVKLNSEREELEEDLESSRLRKMAIKSDVDDMLKGKAGLLGIYRNCNVEQKHLLIHAVFRDGLKWENGGLTSTFFSPSLNHCLKKVLKELSLKESTTERIEP